MSRVFISYSADRRDAQTAEYLTRELERRGLSVFKDHAITAGEDFSHQIHTALLEADVVVVLLSSNSQTGRWIKDEVVTALESRKRVIPVFLDAGAKENWLWPLLADRQAKTVRSDADVRDLAAEIEYSIKSERPAAMLPSMRLAANRTRWLLVAVAIAAALLGALFTLLVTR